MGQTLSQKTIALNCGRKEVSAGEIVDVDADIALANDITGAMAITEFEKYKDVKVFDKDKIVLVNDHFAHNKDIKSAEQCKMMREFAKKHDIKYFFGVGRMGIEHLLLTEKGIVMPYDLVIGADSHTCTYGGLGAFSTGVGSSDLAAIMMSGKIWLNVPEAIQFNLHGELQKYASGKDVILYIIGDIGVEGANYMSMEFVGENNLDMDDRFTIANMGIEAGAKNAIFEVDDMTRAYIKQTARFKDNTRVDQFKDLNLRADKDAEYVVDKEYDLSNLGHK